MLPGGSVSILILLPNLLWVALPPRGQSDGGSGRVGGLRRLMEVFEWAGRIAVLVIPFFYRVEVQSARQVVALVVMAQALLLYYVGWARYFARDRSYALLFQPLLGVPLPLAISPSVYFLAASVLFGSWHLALATVILGIGHLWMSSQASRDV